MRWAGALLVMIGVLFLAEKQLCVALAFVLPGSTILGIWWLIRRQGKQVEAHE